jgi:two-component system response regulator FixJ
MKVVAIMQPYTSRECTVLLVDDDESARQALRCLLEAEGFAVRTFSNANEVLATTKVASNSCLVTDYRMPGMDGLDLVTALRMRGNPIPAILVTGDPNPAVRDRAAAANVPVVEKLNCAKSLVGRIQEMINASVN